MLTIQRKTWLWSRERQDVCHSSLRLVLFTALVSCHKILNITLLTRVTDTCPVTGVLFEREGLVSPRICWTCYNLRLTDNTQPRPDQAGHSTAALGAVCLSLKSAILRDLIKRRTTCNICNPVTFPFPPFFPFYLFIFLRYRVLINFGEKEKE